MHVLITTPSFPPATGGVARVAQIQAEHLARQGHRVTVITGRDLDGDTRSSRSAGVQLLRVPVRTGRFPTYAAGDALGLHQREGRDQYQELLMRCDANVLISHCWQAWNTDWAVDVAERLRFPICLYSHGTSVNDITGRTGWLRWLRWRSYAWARMPRTLRRISILVALDAQADDNRFYDVTLARRHGTKMAVIPNSANPDLQRIAPRRDRRIATPFLALSVGQYSAEKNPGQILESFLRIAPSDWTLVLCGSKPTRYLQRLEKRYAAVSRRRSTPAARFLTGLSQSELADWYQQADLFLAASRTECQPLVLLDAMAAGVPFLSSDVGCVRSLAGGMVARNAAEFDARASALMSSPELRAQLSRAGRLAHETTFNGTVTLKQLDAVLAELVGVSERNRV